MRHPIRAFIVLAATAVIALGNPSAPSLAVNRVKAINGQTTIAIDNPLAFPGNGDAANTIYGLIGSLTYKGGWNATTNSPAIPAASVGNAGWYYIATTAGSTNVGGITSWTVGSWVISDGVSWKKLVNGYQPASAGGGGGSGSVTSVALSAPDVLSVSGSPVTSTGTLALSLANQSANLVFSGPGTGAAAPPTFRGLVEADLPSIGIAKITGVVPAAQGGAGTVTGLLKANGSGTVSAASAGIDYLTPSGTGQSLTSLNASNIALGRLSELYGGAGTISGILKANGSGVVSAAAAGTDYLAPSGNGSALTALNAGNISSGTLAAARGGAGAVNGMMKADGAGLVSAAAAGTDYVAPSGSGAGLTALNGSAIASGVVPSAYGGAGSVTGVMKANGSGVVSAATAGTDYVAPSGSGAGLTALNGSAIASGVVPSAYGGAGSVTGVMKANGSGVVSAATAGTDYLAPSGSGASLTSLNAGNISSGTLAAARGGAGAVSGVLKADGAGLVSAAAAGTDYVAPSGSGSGLTSLNASNISSGTLAAARGGAGTVSGVLKANGSGTVSSATDGTDYYSPTTAVLSPAFVTLTDGATITITCSAAKVFQNAIVTLGGNRTLAISGATNGMQGTLIVLQDGTGSRTLALPAGSLVGGGGAGVAGLSTAANSRDVLCWMYDGTNYNWTVGNGFN